MMIFVTILQLLAALILIAVVLFQSGKSRGLSGAIGGVCGMLQACGTDATLSTGIAGGVGFTAIIVAWLCQLNPGMILVVSFLFGVLEKGSGVVQSSYGLSTDCAAVLQGIIILFFILASEFFVRYAFAGRSSAKGGKKA